MAAMIGAASTIVVGYVGTIVGQAYRHHKEGSAMAAAFLGELNSYKLAQEKMLPAIKGLCELANLGEQLQMPKPDMQNDAVFEANVPRIGLLGVEIVEELVLIYHQIRAHRSAFAMACEPSTTMQASLLTACSALLDNASTLMPPLVEKLRLRANQGFWSWSWQRLIS